MNISCWEVCLDGDNLISYGDDARRVYDEARAKIIEILLSRFVKK